MHTRFVASEHLSWRQEFKKPTASAGAKNSKKPAAAARQLLQCTAAISSRAACLLPLAGTELFFVGQPNTVSKCIDAHTRN